MSKNKRLKRLKELSQKGISKSEAARMLVSEGFCDSFDYARLVVKRFSGSAGKTNNKKVEKWKYPNKPAAKILILDIETSLMRVYVWGLYKQRIPHTNIISDWFVISWAAKWLNDSETFGAVVTPNEAVSCNDRRVIESIWQMLDKADIVICHNGDRFDLRKLNARFLHHGIKPPSPYVSIDTLKQSRNIFAMSSHKQDHLTKFLQLPEKLETEFEMWPKCMNGDKETLKRMFDYNLGDILGLEELYLTLRPWMRSHPNVAIFEAGDRLLCSHCGSENLKLKGSYLTPVNKYDSYQCECGAFTRSRFSAMTTKERRRLGASTAR